MIDMYFGLPRCGKTTLLASMVKKLQRKGIQCYGNVDLKIDGYIKLDNDCFGKYDISNGWVFIDEATVYADSRDYKSMPKSTVEWLMLHGHDKLHICFFAQQWDGVDKKIRNLTERVFYVYKRGLSGLFISKIVKVPYRICFPAQTDEKGKRIPGDIAMGYYEPNFFLRLFAKRLIRPFYYKYFDSWEKVPRPPLPLKYRPYSSKQSQANREIKA